MVQRPAKRWLATIAVLTACGPSAKAPAKPVDAPRGLVRIALERTPCFGFCPEYQVTAAADGQIVFRGLRRWEGIERSWRIPADSVRALGRELVRIGFFQRADITPDKPGCGDMATDHPSIILTANDGEREHRVDYYTGCRGRDFLPAALQRLAGRIDSVTGAAALVDSLQKAGARDR